MFKKTARVLLLVLICMSFTACQTSLKTPTDLIKRPKLSVKNKIAREKVERELPQNAKLIRPLKPGKLNSFGYLDLDSDANDEAYAFYKVEKDNKIGLMILKEESDDWQLACQVQISGTDISYADFIDFNSDGNMDLLFGSDTSEGVYGLVNAYVWQDSDYKSIWTGEFTKLVIDDMNANGNKEILCIKHDRNSYASISAYEYTGSEFSLIDELDMDEYINGYYNVFSGNLTKDQKALFMDFSLGTKSASNIIILKNGKLEPILSLFKSGKSKVGEKINNINSKDINGDGIIEIADTYNLIFAKDDVLNKKGIYEWKQYSPDEDKVFKTVAMSFIDKKAFYEFIFPETWLEASRHGRLIAYTSFEKHKQDFVSFYYLTESLDTYHILSFEYFSNEAYKNFVESEKAKLYNIVELHKNSDSILVAYYNKSLEPYSEEDKNNFSNLIINKDEIKNHLVYLK